MNPLPSAANRSLLSPNSARFEALSGERATIAAAFSIAAPSAGYEQRKDVVDGAVGEQRSEHGGAGQRHRERRHHDRLENTQPPRDLADHPGDERQQVDRQKLREGNPRLGREQHVEHSGRRHQVRRGHHDLEHRHARRRQRQLERPDTDRFSVEDDADKIGGGQ